MFRFLLTWIHNTLPKFLGVGSPLLENRHELFQNTPHYGTVISVTVSMKLIAEPYAGKWQRNAQNVKVSSANGTVPYASLSLIWWRWVVSHITQKFYCLIRQKFLKTSTNITRTFRVYRNVTTWNMQNSSGFVSNKTEPTETWIKGNFV
jgi:hypothetical protein